MFLLDGTFAFDVLQIDKVKQRHFEGTTLQFIGVPGSIHFLLTLIKFHVFN